MPNDTRLLDSTSMARVEHQIIRALLVAALAALPIIWITAAGASEVDVWVSLSPLSIATMNAVLLARRLYRADIALGWSGVSAGVTHSLFGTEELELATTVVIVLLGAVATLFVPSRRWLWAGVYAIFVAVVSIAGSSGEPGVFLVGYTTVGSYLLAVLALSFVASSVRSAATRLTRIQDVLDRVPVALHEEDFSALISELQMLRRRGVVDLGQYIEANPEELHRLFSLIEIISTNRASAELFGVDRDSLRGPVQLEEVEGFNRSAYLSELMDVWEGRTHRNRQMFRTDLGGSKRTVAVEWIVPLESTNATTFIAFTDVTEIIEARDALMKLNRSKDEFVAAISHELRTPLTAVLGFGSELLERSDELATSERHDLLSLIVAQSQAMAHIVEDLLVSARADIGSVTIAPALEDIAAHCRGTADELGMVVDVRAAGPVTGYVDAVRLRQIIRNLLTNADRYGGPNRWIEFDREANLVVVEVHDDGQGVPGEMSERIFETFVSAHAPRAATASVGLGLSVSRYLARCMGGDLIYRSAPGASTFTLTVPVGPPEPGHADRGRDTLTATQPTAGSI